jgi:hypothetical protein
MREQICICSLRVYKSNEVQNITTPSKNMFTSIPVHCWSVYMSAVCSEGAVDSGRSECQGQRHKCGCSLSQTVGYCNESTCHKCGYKFSISLDSWIFFIVFYQLPPNQHEAHTQLLNFPKNKANGAGGVDAFQFSLLCRGKFIWYNLQKSLSKFQTFRNAA